MAVPRNPKIYHIVHVDRLSSIVADGHLWCDAKMFQRTSTGTTIGLEKIKQRRRHKLTLRSYPDLYVGDCVPFYFCPRSVMLYVIEAEKNKNNNLAYQGGQGHIIHLEADLRQTTEWAKEHGWRWAFTLSNAGSFYFEDRCNLADLGHIDWSAIAATYWNDSKIKESKQAEFLVENCFPWQLVSRIGVYSQQIYTNVTSIIRTTEHRPQVEIKRDWYY